MGQLTDSISENYPDLLFSVLPIFFFYDFSFHSPPPIYLLAII